VAGDSVSDREAGIVLSKMIETIHGEAKRLSEIDGAIGDGDHGINMDKGFQKCGERLSARQVGMVEGLAVLGDVLISEIGGSMGPLYGTLFLEMSEGGGAAKGARIDAEALRRMLDRGLSAVRDLSGAQVGDKTILDALVPAVEAYRQSVAAGAGFAAALSALRDAAQKGMESTRDLVAKVGRSSRLGERSRGTLDAGAASCALLLGAMADALRSLLGRAA